MNNIIDTITNGKYKKFKVIFSITICVYFLCIVSLPLLSSFSVNINDWIIYLIILAWLFLIEIFYYILKIHPLKKSVKHAESDGSLQYINEIIEKKYDTDGRIAFSDHFFYDIKKCFFISYKSILWIYKKDGGYVIKTINGKKFLSKIDSNNLQSLLNSYPHILESYDIENYNSYVNKVNSFRVKLNAETIVFDIPSLKIRFWKWLSDKVHWRVFFIVGITSEAIFFAFLIFAANTTMDLPNWLFFYLLLPLLGIGLASLLISIKLDQLKPESKSGLKNKTTASYKNSGKTNAQTAAEKPTYINKEFLFRLFGVKKDEKKLSFIALDKRDGRAVKINEFPIYAGSTCSYKVEYITYDDVRKYARINNIPYDYKELSADNWKNFLNGDKSEVILKKCKFCKKDVSENDLDKNGYCPHCADSWWKSDEISDSDN